MGSQELIAALRAEADRRMAEIRARAEAEVRAIELEAQVQAEALRKEAEAKLRETIKALKTSSTAEAARLGRAELSRAEGVISERLYEAARGELTFMRTRFLYREEHLAELIAELPGPKEHWKRIYVNPEDAHEARRLMGSVEIIKDPAISGGLRAQSEDGRVMVDNTLDRRLERAWPAMLPELMKELHARHY